MSNDNLVVGVSRLCNLQKKFHCKKREVQLKSLTKYLKEFKSFTTEEFVNFVCRQYIECLRKRQRFCSQSIYNRVSAIQSRLDINVLPRSRYNSVLKSLRKLFNPYSNESMFFTNTGDLIQIPAEEFQMLRDNAKYLMEQNHTNMPDRWLLNTYTDEEIENVYAYFKLNLENFLQNNTSVRCDNIFVELCMLIVFNYNTPRRISEIMDMRVCQVEQLILHNTLNIKSKDGYNIDCIYVSVWLADLLNRYVTKLYPHIFGEHGALHLANEKIFTGTYKMYYGRMRKVLKTLIGKDRLKNLRIFHGFRNFYANKHLDSSECPRILGHRNQSMTRRYARGQKQTKAFEENKKTRVLNYLNRIAENT